MNIAGYLNYDTKVNTDGIKDGVNKVSKEAKGMADSLKVAIGNIISDLAKLAAQGVKQIVSTGIQYNAEIQKYQTALTTLTGSAEKANDIIEQIKKDAATTPFDVQGLVQANQLLISAGVSSEDAREDILNLGNAISATGGGNEELSRMVVNLQQIKNVGKASSLDIKQFAYAGIDVYGLLADSMGVTREEASNLDVTYEDLTKALKNAASEGGKYYKAMENQSKTFNGQISNLKDNFNAFIGEAMTPLFDLLQNDILPIINDILSGTGNIEELIPQLTNTILNFLMNTIQKLIDNLPQLVQIGINIIFNLVNGIIATIPTLIPAITQAVITIINTLIDNLDQLIDAGIELLLAIIEGLIDAIPMLIEAIPTIIEKLVKKLTSPEMLAKLISAAIQLMIGLAVGLINAIPELIKAVPKIISSLFTGLKNIITETDWKKLGTDVLNGIIDGLTRFGNKISNAAKKIYTEIKNKIKDFFGIASPSKKMRDEIGKFIPQGIAVGIETDTDSALEAIDDMNEAMMDKVKGAVQLETGAISFSGTNGTITQMLSAFGTTTVVNENKLYLDGDEIYENQQTVSAKKNLQTQFGGGYSVSS